MRKVITPVNLLIIGSIIIYVLGMSGFLFSKANAEQTIKLLHKEWVFQHSIINETTVQHFTFENTGETEVVLQRLDGEEWINLHEHQFSEDEANKRTISVNIESPSEKGFVNYRIVSGKINHHPIFEFTVQNHDPDDYSDYIKQAYDAMKNYCPNVFITEGDYEDMSKRKVMGLANSGANKIEIREKMDLETVQWVAGHECGHILQHRAYDKDRETYPISEKRSILWLNDELSPFYDKKFENDRGTGFSEKNANCIADYIVSIKDFYNNCPGNQGQAVHNIIEGKTFGSLIIHENIADAARIKNTGFAVKEAECKYDSGVVSECSQQFEYGTVEWRMIDGKDSLIFIRADGTVSFGVKYFNPPLFYSYSNFEFNNKKIKEMLELYSPSEEND